MKALTKEEALAKFNELDELAKKLTPQKRTKLVAKAADAGVISFENVAIADGGEEEECEKVTKSDIEYLSMRLDSIRQDYWRLWEALYEHKNEGHLPKIVGAERMEKALKALGLNGDYKVEPKTIYASTGEVESVELSFKAHA